MTDRRAVLGLVPGIIGLGLGIAALALDLPALGLIAGVCAIVAAFVARQPAAPAPAPEPVPDTVPETVPARRRTDLEADVNDEPEPIAVAEPVEINEPEPEVAEVVHLPSDATRKVEKVMTAPITDPTGLFSEDYFHIAVETRVSAVRAGISARSRSCYSTSCKACEPEHRHESLPSPSCKPSARHCVKQTPRAVSPTDGSVSCSRTLPRMARSGLSSACARAH